MSDAKKSMTVTKRDKEFHIDVNLNGQELYETLVALIGYVRGSFYISFIRGSVHRGNETDGKKWIIWRK